MNSKIIKLEHEISNLIQKDNGNTVHFEYVQTLESPANTKLLSQFKEPNIEEIVSAYTVNHTTQEQFLLKSVQALSKEAALEIILEYVRKQKELGPFTVIWAKRDSGSHTNTSYFYCHDIMDALTNFFKGKEVKDYIIHEVKSNPIS
jgi:hypothetical protein